MKAEIAALNSLVENYKKEIETQRNSKSEISSSNDAKIEGYRIEIRKLKGDIKILEIKL